MLASFVSGFADISLGQLALIAVMALIASVIGGVSGYGTGALMPLILVPIVGPEPVVPMLSLSALLNNTSRAAVFHNLIDFRRVLVVLPLALPTTMLGAWGYTRLTGRGVMVLIGTMMILSVPLRRLLKQRGFGLSNRGLALSAAGWSLVAGGTTGAGVAAGLQGVAVIATDAVVSIGVGLAKVSVFGFAGAIGPKELALALLMGGMAFPGAFLAKAMVEHLSVRMHTALLDVVVVAGGAIMLYGASTR